MSTAIYTRSARPSHTTSATQRDACEELAQELGYEVTRVYRDEGIIQSSLLQLLDDAAECTLSVLFVNTFDRLSRNLATHQRVMSRLRDAGVTVYVVELGKEPVTDDSDQAILTQFVAICEANNIASVTE